MNVVRRSREELESYMDGYIAAVRDMYTEQRKTANCRNQVRELLNKMKERRDFLRETFGYKEQISDCDDCKNPCIMYEKGMKGCNQTGSESEDDET